MTLCLQKQDEGRLENATSREEKIMKRCGSREDTPKFQNG